MALGLTMEGTCLFKADPCDPETVLQGCMHRQVCETPPIDRELMREWRAHNWAFITSRITPANEVMTFDNWLRRKWNVYSDTQKALLVVARARWDSGSRQQRMKWLRSTVFVKDEFYPEVKHARMIVNRTLEWLSFMGPLMTTCEDQVYQLPQFVKHVTEKERIAIVSDVATPYVTVLEGDYTSFESSFVPRVIANCEWLLVKHIAAHALTTEELDILQQDMYKGESVLSHRHFTVRVRGRRKSGDAHTSMANGFTNFMLYRFAMLRQFPGNCAVAENVKVEGDDSAGAAPLVARRLFEHTMEALGFRLKLNVHTDPMRITFCQTQHISTGVVVRDPRPILAKFGWSGSRHVSFNKKHLLMLLRSKALSLAASLPGCPIIWALAACAIRLTEKVDVDWHFVRRHQTSYEREVTEFSQTVVPPTMEARVRVEQDFGINITSQLVLENYFHAKSDLGPCCHPLLIDILPRRWRVFYDAMSNGPVPAAYDPLLAATLRPDFY